MSVMWKDFTEKWLTTLTERKHQPNKSKPYCVRKTHYVC